MGQNLTALRSIVFLFAIFFSNQCFSAASEQSSNFLWGAAFSSHQTEGKDFNSDWWEWEKIPGKISRNENTRKATDHYHRFREDFSLADRLGLKAIRFSVSWARIEPRPGVFDQAVLNHYLDVVLDLRARGMIPVVTLHHFTHPKWFQEMGGWLRPDSPEIFARFCEKVSSSLYPHVPIWITFNEPMVLITEGFLKGGYPPGIRDFSSAVKAFENLVRAHGLASKVLKAKMPPNAEDLPIHGVGLALNMHWFDPVGKDDSEAIDILSHLSQWAFLEAVQSGMLSWKIPSIPNLPKGYEEKKFIPEAKNSIDWIGVNYYSRYQIAKDPTNSLGIRWEVPKEGLIHAPGLFKILLETKKHLANPTPIVVSENGLDDATDSVRPKFLRDHLNSVAQARAQGVDVRGYWYWSLTDNFEWLEGFKPRFGLIKINYKTLARSIRSSAYFLRDYILRFPDGPGVGFSAMTAPAGRDGFVLELNSLGVDSGEVMQKVDAAAKMGSSHFNIPVLLCQADLAATQMQWCWNQFDALKSIVQLLKQRGFSVGIFPFLLANDGTWRGFFEPRNFHQWSKNYLAKLIELAEVVKDLGVSDFLEGSELNHLYLGRNLREQEVRTQFWKKVYKEIKTRLPTASVFIVANWDQYNQIPFWEASDYIGLSAYYPLAQTAQDSTTVDSLEKKWREWASLLNTVSEKNNRQLYFSEVGYTSRAVAAREPWRYDSDDPLDFELQSRLFEAFGRVWAEDPILKNRLARVMLWALTTSDDPMNDGGYTVIGKPAEKTVQKLFNARAISPSPLDTQ